MRKSNIIIFIFIALFSLGSKAQRDVPRIEISKAEKELFDLINSYRKQKGLPAIPLSKNLTYVAQMHVKDLADNHPYSNRCNLHSWSGKGLWSPCCYTEDHAEAACMWDKPKELSNYPGLGYEIAYWTNEPLNAVNFAKKALAGWQRSVPHNVVILNQGHWKQKTWKAMGVGVYKGYAVAWFGEEADPEELIFEN